MRRLVFACVLVLIGLTTLATESAAATARVSYVTSRTVYVDAGSELGLRIGDVLTIVRAGEVIGTVRVRELSSKRSACEWIEGTSTAAVGDEARFEIASGQDAGPGATEGWWRRTGLRGRIGLQTLHLRDRSGGDRDLDRPALDLRLRGDSVAGSIVSVEADVRAHRLHRGGRDDVGTRTRSRVVRLNAAARSSTLAFVLGRQYAPAVRAVHLFDGARVERVGERWNFGVLAGTQPDPDDFGLSSTVREAGAWVTRRNRDARTRWELTTAAIVSYQESTLNREFLLVQGTWARGAWSGRLEQEIDLNRSWKRDAGESALSATSTHLQARWQLRPDLAFDGGFDNRRRVRLFRDRQTPETEFDDAYRRGSWLGVWARPIHGLDLGLRAQRHSGAGAESADALTLTATGRGPWTAGLRVTSRTTVYRNELVEGGLQSLSVGHTLAERLDVGVFGGVRHETGRSNDLMDGTDPWLGVEFDLSLPSHAWVSATYERTLQGEEAFDQLWIGSGLRF